MFLRVLFLSIPFWVGGSQVREAEKGIEWRESGGILPAGTVWERAREMAGRQGTPAFQPRGGSIRPGRRRYRRRGARRVAVLEVEVREEEAASAPPADPPGPVAGPAWQEGLQRMGRPEDYVLGGAGGWIEARRQERWAGRVSAWEAWVEERWGLALQELERGWDPPAGAGPAEDDGDLEGEVVGGSGPTGGAGGSRPQGACRASSPGSAWVPGAAGALAGGALTGHPLAQFREELYRLWPARADALMELLDALCASPWARSVAELSLSPLFRREYASLYDALDALLPAPGPDQAAQRQLWEAQVRQLIGSFLPRPQQQPYWLLGTDTVSLSRPYAQTLEDRSFVHQANPVGGNAPVTIGHQYSMLVVVPEKEAAEDPPWVLPLARQRVASGEKAVVVGAAQLRDLMTEAQLPFRGTLCVHVADSDYSTAAFLGRVGDLDDLVEVVRVAENRKFYRAAPPPPGRPKGHPKWYGSPFDLKQPATWGPPQEEVETTWTTKRGRVLRMRLQAWPDLRMRGKRGLPMHGYPFTLIRGVALDEQGQRVFKRTLWLLVGGSRRGEIPLLEAWTCYRRRFDLEHFFRFGKQRLLLASYQTPEVDHEESWVLLVQLAAVQLWLGRDLAEGPVRPWERYAPHPPQRAPSPSQVQRDWERIIRRIGTPARPPKPRGKARGRSPGVSPGRRPRVAVVKKTPRKRSAQTP